MTQEIYIKVNIPLIKTLKDILNDMSCVSAYRAEIKFRELIKRLEENKE